MKDFVLDIVALVGAGLLIGGVGMWSVPGAMIVAGLLLLVVSVMGVRRWA